MGAHPNVILMAVLTPKGLARQTMKAITQSEFGKDYNREAADQITIGEQKYYPLVMESDYDKGFQIAAKEGDLVFHDHATYGYGDVITWAELQSRRDALEAWAKQTSEKHSCDYRIDVSANYW